MDCMQQTIYSRGLNIDHCQLKLVNFEIHDNHISHETQGLSTHQLVVRRGKAFRVTLIFHHSMDWLTHSLDLGVQLGDLTERFPVKFSKECLSPIRWSARVFPEDVRSQLISIHIVSPVMSSVATYHLFLHIKSQFNIYNYELGTFVLLCNPWLKDDPVYLPLDVQLQEYVKSDYGVVYTGTHQSVSQQPWAFGQYEPGILEACLRLLQVSPKHLSNKHRDYIRRADPVYLCRVLCAMVNCNDDLGVLAGKWDGSYTDGVRPTEWTGSAEILHRWVSSNCRPVRYGQCWVFACVLCTVMRVLGIPSRVVTVFNSAHDSNANQKIEEYYSSSGEKYNLSNDSIWNFHVWVECWMRRADIGAEFDGWQVVDPTPQEKSAGVYCCGPCPVSAVQRRCLRCPYDTSFIYSSVDADVIRLIIRDRLVVGRSVDTELVGQLIYTKGIGSDKPQNLTSTYKTSRGAKLPASKNGSLRRCGQSTPEFFHTKMSAHVLYSSPVTGTADSSPSLEVSLDLEKVPAVGDSICLCVTVTNRSGHARFLMEDMNLQLKRYNCCPHESFWSTYRQMEVQPGQVLTLHHVIPPSQYKSLLAHDDIVNAAVVIKDVRTKEIVLAAQEFNMSQQQINIEVEGGDSIQMKKDYKVHVSFRNQSASVLSGALLAVEGYGLLQSRHESRHALLQPGETMKTIVSIMASSPGTKLLLGTFSHSSTPDVVARTFHKVSVQTQ